MSSISTIQTWQLNTNSFSLKPLRSYVLVRKLTVSYKIIERHSQGAKSHTPAKLYWHNLITGQSKTHYKPSSCKERTQIKSSNLLNAHRTLFIRQSKTHSQTIDVQIFQFAQRYTDTRASFLHTKEPPLSTYNPTWPLQWLQQVRLLLKVKVCCWQYCRKWTPGFHTEGVGALHSPRNLEIGYGYYCVLFGKFVPDCV